MNKKKYGIGIVDLVIGAILLVIISLFAYVCFFESFQNLSVNEEPFDITLLVTGISSKNSDLKKPGDKISLDSGKNYHGSIKSIKFDKANFEYINKANNTSVTYKLPDTNNATMLVAFNGEIENDTIRISGVYVSEGDTIVFNTPDVTFSARIINIVKR